MWDVLLQNWPSTLVVLIAIIICGAELIKAIRVWREERKRKIDSKVEEKQKELDIQKEFERLHERFDTIDKRLNTLEGRMAVAEMQLKDLIVSDMHDIKSWMVDQYHKFYVEQGWIDAFSAEVIEKRYKDYENEGGNSYIATLIERLRSLPMDQPADKK